MQGRTVNQFGAVGVSYLRHAHSLLAGASLAVLALAAPALAGTITYTDGQTRTTPIVMTSDTELNMGAGFASQTGVISGAYRLVKSGSGGLLLDGVNSYSGGTTISDGVLFAGNSSALGTGSIEITRGGLSLAATGIFTNDLILTGTGTLASAAEATHTGVISGSGTLLLQSAYGPLHIAGNNTYAGGTSIMGGEVHAENDHAFGTKIVHIYEATLGYASGVTIGNEIRVSKSALSVETGSAIQSGVIGEDQVGSGFSKIGAGELVLRGASTYRGTTRVVEGTLTGGVGYAFSDQSLYSLESSSATLKLLAHQRIGDIAGNGVVDLRDYNLETGNRTNNTRFEGTITGSANSSFTKIGQGSLALSGDANAYGGSFYLAGGSAYIDGDYRNMRTTVTDSFFGGAGRVGDVVIGSGGTLFGSGNGQLSMASLSLGAESRVLVQLGASSDQALFNVAGNLTLDGTLDVQDVGGFGPGVYRLFNYGGTLTNNGLEIGTTPSGYGSDNLSVQTAMVGQVNLVAKSDDRGPLLFWDGDNQANWDNGKIDGGDGQWRTGGRAFTDAEGIQNGAMNPRPGFVVFGGKAGNVEVYSGTGQVRATGMQFATSGYRLYGDMLDIVAGDAIIRVGDGTAASANYVATISNHLDGGGRLTKTDLGTLILDGDNTYWGGTEIRQGTLQIGNGGTSGSIMYDVVNNGVLAFNRSDATSFDGAISGTGAVRVMGGDVTLTAANSYTGGTIVDGGVLRAGAYGAFVDQTAYTVNGGTLDLNNFALNMSSLSGTGGDVAIGASSLTVQQDVDTNFAGSLSGTGSFSKGGRGTLTLSGDSAGFTGETSLGDGTLAVNGKLGGSMDVLATGRLQGTGTVGDTIVSGTIAPGNSIGTLNVAGNITFNPGSIYEVEVNAAGQGDKIIATGAATISGGTVKVLAGMGDYAPATTYTILTANGGRTGAFDSVTSNLAFLDPSLSYDANNVYLTMTRNGTSFQNVGFTRNQIATGGGVEGLGFGNPLYDAVLNLSAPQARTAFDQLSGEIHASAKASMIEDSRFVRNAVNDRIRAAFDGVGAAGGMVTTYVDGKPVPVAANTKGVALWGQGFGSWGHMDGDGNAARLNRKTGGFFVGLDTPVFETWRFGAVAGYSNTSFDAKDRHSSGSSDNYHLGLYGGTNWGNIAFRTGAAYTWHDVSTNRSVSFSSFGNSLKGDYDTRTAQVFGELAYGVNMGATRFEPFANLAYVNLHTDGFSERGGAGALTSSSSNTDATFTTLGLRASSTFELNGASLTAKGALGWRHAFGGVTPISTMRFGGGDAFTVAGVPIARNAAVIEAGLDLALTPNAALGVSYGGQFGSGISDQSVKANFNVKF